MVTETKPKHKLRMTDAEIAALVRRYNPLVHGRRDTLLRQRDALVKAGISATELAEVDAELAKWERRVAHVEGLA